MKPVMSLILGNGTSKLVGVLREMVFASLFGTSSVAAAYRLSQVAFTAPTHGLVLETVSGGLVPLYKRQLEEGEAERQAVADRRFGVEPRDRPRDRRHPVLL